ncbi:hypothetical protein ACQP0C_21630 [Nocardia sp. CA-129566]|uniref:hypothetical protein n=1 Tax=Nocardia sp. CA-129566 TaxID=3239976 RepID=UPI003D98CC80
MTAGGLEAGAAKAAGGLAVSAGKWLLRKLRPDTSRLSLSHYAIELADAVQRREDRMRDEARSGPDAFMNVGYSLRRAGVDGGEAVPGTVANADRALRKLPDPVRLVVTGAPGAGKTVFTIHLLLARLRHRATLNHEAAVSVPVPVRVNAAGWSGGSEFTTWLAKQISLGYGLPARIARALIDHGYVLPILDGLDEMGTEDAAIARADAVLESLNAPPWRNRPVVVTCRAEVFARLKQIRGDAGVHGAMEIALQPLTPNQAQRYLTEARKAIGIPAHNWAPVTDLLTRQPDGPLGIALRSPWLLGLTLAYLRAGVEPTSTLAGCHDTTQVREVLFAALVPAAVLGTDRTGPAKAYGKDNVATWMFTLARHLEKQRTAGGDGVDIVPNRIWRIAGPIRCRLVHTLLGAIAVGLVLTAAMVVDRGGSAAMPAVLGFIAATGLGFGSAFVTIPAHMRNRRRARRRGRRGFVYIVGCAVGYVLAVSVDSALGLGVAVGFGLGHGLGFAPVEHLSPERFARRVPGRPRHWRGLVAGVLVGGLTGAFGVLRAGPTVGIAVGAATALMAGLIAGFKTVPRDSSVLDHDERQVVRNDLVFGLIFGTSTGIIAGMVGVLLFGTTLWLAAGLGIGLGSLMGFSVVSERYVIAVSIFHLTNAFAPRPNHFLAWACEVGLLRKTNAAFQFRHSTYQRWVLNHGPDHPPQP